MIQSQNKENRSANIQNNNITTNQIGEISNNKSSDTDGDIFQTVRGAPVAIYLCLLTN